MAELMMAQGRLYEAEDYVLRANQNTMTALPKNYAEQGKGLNMLGVLYMRTNRLEQSEAVLKKAIELLERQEDATLVSLALQNLANTLSANGRDEEAEPLAKRALAMRQKEQPPIPENIALSISALGGIARRSRCSSRI
ncbi:MAG: tetratricopeptide repeat protein [Hyphomicrobium sp.]